MKKKHLFWQLYTSSFLIIFLALFAFTFLISSSFKNILLTQVSEDLVARASLLHEETLQRIGGGTEQGLDSHIDDLGKRSATRITVILPDGRVIADSEHDPASMNNHRERPEIRHALEKGEAGTSTRFSATLTQNLTSAAVPLQEQDRIAGVLRTAVPVYQVEESIADLQWKIVLGGIAIALFAGLISLIVSRRITRPIERLKLGAHRFAEGDLGFRLPIPDSEELSDLAEVTQYFPVWLKE